MLNINNISFSYQDQQVLKDISFSLEKGKHLAIMGESGSGKSTLLRAIYGLLHLNSGTVSWEEKMVLGPNFNLIPGEHYMKLVSQNFDLMPFTSVAENIGQHLSVFERETHEDRINELLEVIEMEAYADIKVKNLSGGQQQRVALARALAQEPEILLLDEPFSNIDQFKKNHLRQKLFPYLKQQGITVLTATHDPNDVLSFSDELLVLKEGSIITHDETEKTYKNPTEKYIAQLFGEVNELPLKLLKDYAELDVSILVYPHEFELSSSSGFQVIIKEVFFKGTHYLIKALYENDHTLYFNHKTPLKKEAQVFLNVSLALITKRLENQRAHES